MVETRKVRCHRLVSAGVSRGRGFAAALIVPSLVVAVWAGADTPVASGETDPTSADILASGAGHAQYDFFAPSGAPRGVVILLHGGGWQDWPGLARAQMTAGAVSLQKDGFIAIDASYAQAPGVDNPGALDPSPKQALDDVVAFVDQVGSAFPGLPVCLLGQSAGAQLALMAAIERPSIACVIDESGPSDLPAWQKAASGSAGGAGPFTCSSAPSLSWWYADCYVSRIFGSNPADLRFWSPALRWDPAVDHTALLIAAEQDDQYVLPVNAASMVAADPLAELRVLHGDPNGVMFIHSLVDPADAAAFDREQFSFIEEHGLPAGQPTTTVAPVRSDGTIATCDAATGPAPAGPALGAWRSALLDSGAAWAQQPARDDTVVAADGCSGSEASNQDGVSVFVPATAPGALPARTGSAASQIIFAPAGRALTALTTSVRGFVSAGWVMWLAAYGTHGESTALAACTTGECVGLSGGPAYSGELISSGDDAASAEQADTLPDMRFRLPADTTAIAVSLVCEAPAGCSRSTLNPDGNPSSTVPLRPRDPNGSPAIVSLYDPVVQTVAATTPGGVSIGASPRKVGRPRVRIVHVRRAGSRRVLIKLVCRGTTVCHVRVRVRFRVRAGHRTINARAAVRRSRPFVLTVMLPPGSSRLRVTAWLQASVPPNSYRAAR